MEEGYRRGAILGLTIAEIFILLVFLMLLALMGVNFYWSNRFEPWEPIIEKYTPKEVIEALEPSDKLRQEIERLTKQIEELKKEKERLREQIRTLIGETGEKLDEAEEKLREVKRALAECEEALEDARRQIDTLTLENGRLRDANSGFQTENNALRNKIRIIGKGITPPCWYQQIKETNPITKANWREKPYYLFDIAIRDDHMEVQRLPIPEGSAKDDGGAPYVEEAEAKELAFDTIPYGTPLTDEKMRDVMRHLYEKGKAAQVRTYSCIFYVRVWDETHSGAKERWKQAHGRVLQQLFGTHQVSGISWEDRHKEPVNVPISDQVDTQ